MGKVGAMGDHSSRRLTRRRLLQGAVGGALTITAGDALALAKPHRGPRNIRHGSFGSGVAAGLPGTRSIVLWTRVDGIERGGTLWLELARDPEFRHLITKRPVRSRASKDFTVHAPVRGLRPGREYYYRFHTRRSGSPVGRFRTLRPPDSREPLRLAFWSCQAWQAGYYA